MLFICSYHVSLKVSSLHNYHYHVVKYPISHLKSMKQIISFHTSIKDHLFFLNEDHIFDVDLTTCPFYDDVHDR